MENDSINIDYFINLINDNKYEEVIDKITNLLDSNPDYLNGNYLSFPNAFEKAIYEKYFDSLSQHILFDDFNLDELFLCYSDSFLNIGEIDDAVKYLKIANKINPVSTSILIRLSNIYSERGDLEKVKEISEDIFKFNYYSEILFSNYYNFAELYSSDNPNIYSNVFNLILNSKSIEYNELLEKNLIYLNNLGIPIGFNPELIELSKTLYDDAILNNLNDSKLFEKIYKHLYSFNSYYKGLSLDINLDDITEEIKILIANNEIDNAILKIKNFLENDSLDLSLNYKIFNTEIEREFYYNSPNFDYNFILLPKHKNYYYLYYLYGFCLNKKEDYECAAKQYKIALQFNPYNIFINSALLKIKFENHFPVKVAELNYLLDICYKQEDLCSVYKLFCEYLENEGRREDSELIDSFITCLITKNYGNINLNAIKLLKENNFTIGFNPEVIKYLTKVIKYYAENKIKNIEVYERYLKECMDLNEHLSNFKDLDVYLNKTKLLKEFKDEELIDSFILIEDKFSQKYYSNINALKIDYDEKEFDLSDSFICYCYKQVTGGLAFLMLSVSKIDEEIIIFNRQYFDQDRIFSKELLENEKATILNDLTQFNHYIDVSDDYHRWIERNISGNSETDKKFLLNELNNVKDDPFNYKKKSIGDELRKIIKPKDLIKKEIPCEECITHINDLINSNNYEKALMDINNFLEKYPPLYFDGYMEKYHYFDDLERDIYMEYAQPSGRIILLPKSQNYCEIFNLKAQILIRFYKYDDAIDCLVDYCLKFNPLNVKANILLSEIFYKKEDLEYSKQLLKEALLFNRNLETHIKIYDKLNSICHQLNEHKLAEDLSKLSQILKNLEFDNNEIFNIKNSIIDDEIYFGFNPDVIQDNEELLAINEKLYNGTSIDNILQQIKPLIDKWPRVSYEKLGRYISKNNTIQGYEIPYLKFDMSLMYNDKTYGDEYFNFENNVDYKIFKQLNPSWQDLKLIPAEFKVCELLNTYAYSLKYFSAGKSVEVLKESIKLNPVNSKSLLIFTDIYLKLDWLDEAKESFDELFKICWDKNVLIKAYMNLSEYYRKKGLYDTSKSIEKFVEFVKNNKFENREYIAIFKKHDIQLGFNRNLLNIIENVDMQIFKEMYEFNMEIGLNV